MSECSICYGKYNKTKNAKVSCFGCEYESCRECLSRYLLDPNTTTPNCPFCHKEWTREFLLKSFTQKFVNTDIKHHREDVLLQREKAMLPIRQAEAERRKQMAALAVRITEIERQIAELGHQRYMVQSQLTAIRYGRADDGGAAAPTRREFIQPCPNGECRGFLSTQWKCGMCEQWSCKDCHEVKGPHQNSPHTCDTDKVASAKLIAEETKPCPKCGVRLFKISGCNQMWCTACNDCAFDWVTGKIEKTIHNPHYFEYQRRLNGGTIPRQPGDVQCGFEIDHYTSREINRLLYPYRECRVVRYNTDLLDEVCRMSVHITHALIPRYRIDPVRYNEEYGVSYIMGEITEDEFKVKLQRADKKYQMSHEIMNVLQMSTQTLRDITGRYIDSLNNNPPGRLSPRMLIQQGMKLDGILPVLEGVFPILQEVFPLFEYANECLSKIATVYGSKSPVVLQLDLKDLKVKD
jgi:hypothetical protein